jgi:hypothetical protein
VTAIVQHERFDNLANLNLLSSPRHLAAQRQPVEKEHHDAG